MKHILHCLIACIAMTSMIACTESSNVLVFSNTTIVARVTGTPLDDAETYLNPNNTTDDYNVGGTDLGIMWEMNPDEYGIFFGDTYGSGFEFDTLTMAPNGSEWRCNVLAFSKKEDLDKGLTITGMVVDAEKSAREIIYGAKDQSGTGDWTSIPTAAIRANGTDYVHYMNVRNWKDADWDTNYSRLFKSADNGQRWEPCSSVAFGEDSNFGQVAYWKKDGFIYMIGTKSGRLSTVRLARFKESDIEQQDLYEYWNKEQGKWLKNQEDVASNLFEDTVGELSFIYHTKTGQWIMAYFNSGAYNITVRYAKDIAGEWSEPVDVAYGNKGYPQLYGSYIHPQSADSDHLYFLMSMWKPYNVFLMKTDITIK